MHDASYWHAPLRKWGDHVPLLEDHTPIARTDADVVAHMFGDTVDVFGFAAYALAPFIEDHFGIEGRIPIGASPVAVGAYVERYRAMPVVMRSREMVESLARDHLRWGFGAAMRHDIVAAAIAAASLSAWMWLLEDDAMAADLTRHDIHGVCGARAFHMLAEDRGWPSPARDLATSCGGTIGAMMDGHHCRPGCPRCFM